MIFITLWHNIPSFSFGKKNMHLKTAETIKIIKIMFVSFKQCCKDMMVKSYLYLAIWQIGDETLRVYVLDISFCQDRTCCTQNWRKTSSY